MALPLPIPPLRLFEIDDQSWFPAPCRASVQACLTHLWTFKAPLLQATSPASLVAKTLQGILRSRLKDYTFVDFCSGAGGPTPFIEQEVNKSYKQAQKEKGLRNGQLGSNRHFNGDADGGNGRGSVDFVMTDIHPHLQAWSAASAQSENLHYVPTSVDAANAPQDLLSLAGTREGTNKQTFRLFSLAFHHFPDPLAVAILQDTLATSSGFAILELQGRDFGNIFTVLMLGPLLWLGSWYWFWGQWGQLFWTYIVPIVPFVLVFDGIVSCLRTRRDGEVMALIREAVKSGGCSLDGWRFEMGTALHTWPTGRMQYFVGVREGEGKKGS
ncbi:hypothetical protein N7G274_001265 [Stereocaulon virgatum]|uniref:Uncharacterized protein n=1 Tax=Stereocaulon virgatum TaxID=373712 RepID=A0ABR4ANX6_9LECA